MAAHSYPRPSAIRACVFARSAECRSCSAQSSSVCNVRLVMCFCQHSLSRRLRLARRASKSHLMDDVRVEDPKYMVADSLHRPPP